MTLPVTYLFVPADRPDRFAKALGSGADRVILDLEDAVRAEAKSAAREAIRNAGLDWRRIVIRMNPADSPFWDDDLALLKRIRPPAVMLPKAESAAVIAMIVERSGPGTTVLPQIETARGLDRIDQLLTATGVRRVAFGHLDFAADLDAEPVREALSFARHRLVWRSRVMERGAPLDSVTARIDDAATHEESAAARALGFGGKLLIHPAQVAPCARAFAPTDAQIIWARRVIAATSSGQPGAVALDGQMIDKPVENAARRVLDRARQNAE
ncbi:HpcH/HpaI aldolase/citrate lyase family protein [Palleronia caenipelagi]|uniref:CoA ester lyase n=1 Tax=Palleronia caenipelagi TaxID=2489174 RepID=A0A547Q6L4_9RHOB|nr:CoA ester lyase [Palleronia caenipelagi]TRD22028.1 CoA ester lyase [Palleronia caenipelagi]